MAINIIDGYTSRQVTGNLDVMLKGHNADTYPLRNPSGYYLFFDIMDKSCIVEVDGGEYYFGEKEKVVSLNDLDELNPVVDIYLKPTPSYPFPSNATLIRGFLMDSKGMGVPDAILEIKGRDNRTMTSGKGEFIIFFDGLTKKDVVKTDDRMLVKINEKNPIIVFDHPDHKTLTKTVEVVEAVTTMLSITYQ